jgi:hypothetical protein
MKKLLLSILFYPIALFGADNGKAIQPTYVDALKLSELKITYDRARTTNAFNQKEIIDKIADILQRYGTEEELRNNPSLAELATLEVEVSNAMTTGGGRGPASHGYIEVPDVSYQAAGATSFGWQEAAINGLSTFMAGRFRQEVIHYGLKNVFNTINTRDREIFMELLPEAYKEVNKLQASEITAYYSADLVFLRQIIQSDLKNLKERILTKPDAIFPNAGQLPYGTDVLKLAGQLYLMASRGISLPEIFQQLDQQSYSSPEISKAVKINHIFSEALRDTSGSKRLWIDLNKLNGPIDAENSVTRYFFGLLSLQLAREGIFTDMVQARKITVYYADLNAAEEYLKGLRYQLTNEQGLYLLHLLNEALSKYLNSLITIGIPVDEQTVKLLNKIEKIVIPFTENKYQQGIITILHEMGPYLPGQNQDTYRRTLVFAVQLAETEKAEEVENMLKAYALPIGGSSIKRGSDFNLSLNGYVGLTAGSEKALGNVSQSRGNIGLAAPIGLSATIGGRWTVFASIFDLGSMVNLRLNNDTTSISGVKFEHFITPGIGLYYNFPNSPVTVGSHFSYISNLRNIVYESNEAKVTETNVSVSRLNFSILIDIPFFTLYNRTGKRGL